MHTYDVSLTISPDLPIWPGDPGIVIERIEKIEEGATANVSQIQMGVHVGTHVDAPYHFLGGAAATVEKLPLNLLTGRAYVLQLEDELDLITASVLERAEIPSRTRRLLLKTRNSALWARKEKKFHTDYVALSADGAQFLVDRNIRLVGVDYLSVAPFDQTAPTHEILLSAGVIVVEGLNLSEVSQGRYTLYCLPLKIAGSDGAPARTILVGV
ncbi:MAG: cyclase family protein [Anaerolineales bacterium]|nr:cyclase family protein [Anaerolineales bacterium]